MELIFSIWTVVVFVIFVAITCWAWSSKQKTEMTEAANMIFDEENEPRSDYDG